MAQEPLDPTRRSALRTLGAGVGWSLTWNAFAAAQGATADRQSRPDFTGTWTEIQDDQPRYLSGDGVSVNLRWSSPVRITQDATSIIVTYTTRARSHAAIRMTYGLDGTETKNIDGASVNPQERRSRSAWDGNRLVLVSMADWPDPRLAAPSPTNIVKC